MIAMRDWRNRQTRAFKGRMGDRVSSSLTSRTRSGNCACSCNGKETLLRCFLFPLSPYACCHGVPTVRSQNTSLHYVAFALCARLRTCAPRLFHLPYHCNKIFVAFLSLRAGIWSLPAQKPRPCAFGYQLHTVQIGFTPNVLTPLWGDKSHIPHQVRQLRFVVGNSPVWWRRFSTTKFRFLSFIKISDKINNL